MHKTIIEPIGYMGSYMALHLIQTFIKQIWEMF